MSINLSGHQRITFSSGSVISPPASKSLGFMKAVLEVDPIDRESFQIRIPSESIGTTHDRIAFYVSSSGRIGIGTTDPQTSFDVRDIGEDTVFTSSIAKTEILNIDRLKGISTTALTASGIISASGAVFGSGLTTAGSVTTQTVQQFGDIATKVSFGTREVKLFANNSEGITVKDGAVDINTTLSALAADNKIGEDDETKIDFETANEIHFYANNVEQVYLADNIFGPQSDSDVDLGTTGERWKDAYIDTVTTTTLDAQYRHFDTGSSTLASAGGSIGDIVKFGGSTTTAGKIYYLKQDGTWGETNVTASLGQGASTGSIAVALGTNSDTNGMLLKGMAHLASDPEAGVGQPLFLSTESGSAQSYAPTGSGEIVRIIGHQISGSGIVYFNPSPDFIEIS